MACGLLVVLLGTGACMNRAVRRDVVEDESLTVYLRSYSRLGSTVAQEYDQPVTIAPVRLAHILSRLDIRTRVEDGNERLPAIPTEFLYPMADAMAKALSEATADEQVVAMAIRKTKNFYLFDRKHLTSLVAYARGEHLFLHISRSGIIGRELHGITSLAAGYRFEFRLILVHLSERHLPFDTNHSARHGVGAAHPPPARRQVAGYITHILIRRDHLQIDNRLQDHWFGFLNRLDKCFAACCYKSDFL